MYLRLIAFLAVLLGVSMGSVQAALYRFDFEGVLFEDPSDPSFDVWANLSWSVPADATFTTVDKDFGLAPVSVTGDFTGTPFSVPNGGFLIGQGLGFQRFSINLADDGEDPLNNPLYRIVGLSTSGFYTGNGTSPVFTPGVYGVTAFTSEAESFERATLTITYVRSSAVPGPAAGIAFALGALASRRRQRAA